MSQNPRIENQTVDVTLIVCVVSTYSYCLEDLIRDYSIVTFQRILTAQKTG